MICNSLFVGLPLLQIRQSPCTVSQSETLCYQRFTHTHTHGTSERGRQHRVRERKQSERARLRVGWYATISCFAFSAHRGLCPLCQAKGKRGSTKTMPQKATSSSPQTTRLLGPMQHIPNPQITLNLNPKSPEPYTLYLVESLAGISEGKA